jgi:hypothetical protein
MKKRTFLLLLGFYLISLIKGYTQEKSIKEHTLWLNNWELNSSITIQIGTMLPIGQLSDNLDVSPQFGVYLGVPINHSYRIDLGVNLFFPQEKEPIKYFTGSETLEGGTLISGALGCSLTKVKRIGEKLYWDKKVGLGLGFFQTDIETGKEKEENDSVYSSETIYLNFGTALRTEIFKSNIGLELNYFLSPYNLFKKSLPRKFGNQYLTLALSYGF